MLTTFRSVECRNTNKLQVTNQFVHMTKESEAVKYTCTKPNVCKVTSPHIVKILQTDLT